MIPSTLLWFVLAQPPEPLTLAAALTRARDVSPELGAARAEVASARGRARAADALLPENPELEVVYRTDAPFAGEGEGGHELSLGQRFEISGARGAQKAAAAADLAAAEAALASAEVALRERVAVAVYELDFQRRRVEGFEAAASQAERLSEGARRRFELGDIAETELVLLQADAAQFAAEADAARVELHAATALLAGLMGQPDASGISVAVPDPPPDPDALDGSRLLSRALATRPDLRAADLEIEARARDADARGRERWPMPHLRVQYSRERTVLGTLSSTGDLLGAAVAFPLPLFRTGRGEEDEALALRAGAEARRAALARDIAVQVRTVHARYEAARAQNARFATIAEPLHRAQTAYDEAYAKGRLGLPDYLAFRDRILRANLAALTATRDLAIARIELEAATGGPLAQSSSGEDRP